MGKYRHEIKMSINSFDKAILSSRLSHVLPRDKHAGFNGAYLVRSIYFDDCDNTALQDKLIGVKYREKFRLRTYDLNTSLIKLEKKVKNNNLGYKEGAPLSREECQSILNGSSDFLKDRPENLCRQLYTKMRTGLFKTKTIVQYEREAYVWEPGRVRITIDSKLQTGLNSLAFLDFAIPLTPVIDNDVSILEIKYDDFLPAHISNMLQMDSRQRAALSKYVVCRRYG